VNKGTVKWFSPQIGAGSIWSEGGYNVFFRFSAVLNYNPETIYTGQQVLFDIMRNQKGASPSAA